MRKITKLDILDIKFAIDESRDIAGWYEAAFQINIRTYHNCRVDGLPILIFNNKAEMFLLFN